MLAAARARAAARPAAGRAPGAGAGRGRGAAVRRREFDALTFTYLLRYVDDPGATLRELARVVQPGGRDRLARVRRAAARAAASAVARLHARRAAGSRPPGLARVGRGRPLPRPEHRGLLRAHPLARSPTPGGAAGIGAVRVRRMSFGAGVVIDAGDAGGDGERAQRDAARAARVLRAAARAAGATSSRCCTRRTRPGTSATSRSARPLAPHFTPAGSLAALAAFFLGGRASARTRSTSCTAGRCAPRLSDRTLSRSRSPAWPAPWRSASRGRSPSRPTLLPFVAAGAFLVLAYNLELFGGRFHSDLWFALGVGRLPGAHRLLGQRARAARAEAVLVAAACCGAQPRPAPAEHAGARAAPRTAAVEGSQRLTDGSARPSSPPRGWPRRSTAPCARSRSRSSCSRPRSWPRGCDPGTT